MPISSSFINHHRLTGRTTRVKVSQAVTLLNVAQDLADQLRLLDTGDDAKLAATVRTGRDLDLKYPLEALCPVHGRKRFVAVDLTSWLPWNNLAAVFEVRCKNAMEAREIQSGPWNQCRQARHKIQRLQNHMRRAIPERPFIAIDHPTPVIDREAFGRNRRTGDVATQPFQF